MNSTLQAPALGWTNAELAEHFSEYLSAHEEVTGHALVEQEGSDVLEVYTTSMVLTFNAHTLSYLDWRLER